MLSGAQRECELDIPSCPWEVVCELGKNILFFFFFLIFLPSTWSSDSIKLCGSAEP